MMGSPEGVSPLGSMLYMKLASLWNTGKQCDVTIVCENGCIKAPSSLLSAVSEKLGEIVEFSTDKILRFENVDLNVWKRLLDILYTGNISLYLKSEENFLNLFSVLTFAYYVGLEDVLKLFKHICFVEKAKLNSDLWESLSSETNMDIVVEYTHLDDGIATSYKTSFTAENLAGLETYLQESSNEVDVENNLKSLIQETSREIVSVCSVCGDKCEAKSVKCLFCGEIVIREYGVQHMAEKHVLIPSHVWPYSCEEVVSASDFLIGESSVEYVAVKLETSSSNNVGEIWYRCKLCEAKHVNYMTFFTHFFFHGIYPSACQCCGSVFSTEVARNEHINYCGTIDISLQKQLPLTPLKTIENVHGDCEKDYTDGERTNNSTDSLSVLKEKANMKQSIEKTVSKAKMKSQCVQCGDSCTATSVQCLYCYEVVPFNAVHMEQEHDESVQARTWVVSCNIDASNEIRLTRECRGQGYVCSICSFTCKSNEDLIAHLGDMHKVFAVFCCKYCSSGFTTALARNGHQHLCGGGACIQCTVCERLFTSYGHMQLHVKGEHKTRESSNVKKKSVSGKEVSLKKENTSFSDSECEEKDGLETKFFSEHQKFCFHCKELACLADYVKCAYCFKVVENNESHMAKEHPFTPKSSIWPFTCHFYAKTAVNPTEWILTKKIKDKKHGICYKCVKCKSLFFANKHEVNKHVKAKHKMIPQYCKICDVGFSNYQHKRDHQHFCAGGKVLKCDVCQEDIGNFKLLRDHKRQCHNLISSRRKKRTPDDSTENEFEQDVQLGDAASLAVLDDTEDESSHSSYGDASTTIEDTEIHEENQSIGADDLENLNNSIFGTNTIEGDSIAGNLEDEETVQDVSGRVAMCVNCGKNCDAKKVKCLYCFKIVPKDISHMAEQHPFTPKSSLWAYNCRYLAKSEQQGLKDWIISVKESKSGPVNSTNGTQKVQYKCLKCKTLVFSSMKGLKKHVALKHKKSVVTCKICETGFVKTRHKKDHEHFCSGGIPLTCSICDKIVGGHQALDDHVRVVHLSTIKSTLKKENDNTDSEGTENATSNAPNDSVSTNARWEKLKERMTKRKLAQLPWLSAETLVELEREGPRQSFCSNCSSSSCTAEKVKCLYCFKVVDNDASHMDTSHACSPKRSPWVFSCRFLTKTAILPRTWLISRKEHIENAENDYETSGFLYRCITCSTVFFDSPALVEHMEDQHSMTPLMCVMCESGFSHRKYLSYHEHYCGGGMLYRCPECDKEIGNLKDLQLHMTQFHSGRLMDKRMVDELTEITPEPKKKKVPTATLR